MMQTPSTQDAASMRPWLKTTEHVTPIQEANNLIAALQ